MRIRLITDMVPIYTNINPYIVHCVFCYIYCLIKGQPSVNRLNEWNSLFHTHIRRLNYLEHRA